MAAEPPTPSSPKPPAFLRSEAEAAPDASPPAAQPVTSPSPMGEALDGLLSGISTLLASRGSVTERQVVSSGAVPPVVPARPAAPARPAPPARPMVQPPPAAEAKPRAEPAPQQPSSPQSSPGAPSAERPASAPELGSLMGLLSAALHAPGVSPDMAKTSLTLIRHLAQVRSVRVPARLRRQGDPRVSPRLRHWLEQLPPAAGAHVWMSEDGQRLFYAESRLPASDQASGPTTAEAWRGARAGLSPVGLLARLEPSGQDYWLLSMPAFPEFCCCRRVAGPEGMLWAAVDADGLGEPAMVAWPDAPLVGRHPMVAAGWLSSHRQTVPIVIVAPDTLGPDAPAE